ncbi:hypothetical protein FRX31_007694, partial [Thalictrum thalictroides]
VFRCQLRRSNPFYSRDLPKHEDTDKPLCVGGHPVVETSPMDSSTSSSDSNICRLLQRFQQNQLNKENRVLVCILILQLQGQQLQSSGIDQVQRIPSCSCRP